MDINECKRKGVPSWPNREDAERHARADVNSRGGKAWIYRCRKCSWWHMDRSWAKEPVPSVKNAIDVDMSAEAYDRDRRADADKARELERSACTKKESYPDRETAEAMGRRNMRRDPSIKLYVYKCRYCGEWHLSHKNYGAGEEIPDGDPVLDDELVAMWRDEKEEVRRRRAERARKREKNKKARGR